MALLMQDFGNYCGLHIWIELEDDSLQVKDQTRLLLFVKNENRKVTVNKIEIKFTMKPGGPMIMPNPITMDNIVPGRTIRELLPLIVGNSKTGNYALHLSVDFQLVPATWELDLLLFQVQ